MSDNAPGPRRGPGRPRGRAFPDRFGIGDQSSADLGFTPQAIDQVGINRALDLSLRIGELLLANGASSLDTVLAMRTVTRAAGLRGAQVDITLTTIMISYQGSIDQVPVTRIHFVPHRDLDYSVLERIEQILRDLSSGRTSLAGARVRVDDTYASPGRNPQWARLLANAMLGSGVGLLLEGSWLVILVAGVAAMVIELITQLLQRIGIPSFFSFVAGGFLATMAAAGIRVLAPDHSSSLLIAAMIIVLLAGMTIVTAVQDALVGYLVTSAARGLDAALTTAGIIAGVALGLGVSNQFGLVMAAASYTPPNLRSLLLAIPAAALVVLGFAISSSMPLRGWAPVAALGALGVTVSIVASQTGSLLGVAAGAVAIGAAAVPLADWMRLPTLILTIPALVPLLPGLRLYRGLYLLSQGFPDGWARVAEAIGIAIALAAGVLLGEYLASPLRRLTTRRLSAS